MQKVHNYYGVSRYLGLSLQRESQGRIFAPRPAKQQNNLSASLPWNGR